MTCPPKGLPRRRAIGFFQFSSKTLERFFPFILVMSLKNRYPIGASGPCILVTGGAGYVGSHVVLELLDSEFRVVVLDSLVTGFRWAVDPRATFVEGCVEDEALVRRLLHDHEVCAILHFAGSTIAPESVRDPLKYYRNNTVATRSLLESVVAKQVCHFVCPRLPQNTACGT